LSLFQQTLKLEKKNSALNMPTFKVEEMPPEQESFEQIPGANYFRLC
jgi:hypothetical protein